MVNFIKILILGLLLASCTPKIIERTEYKTYIDTVYIKKNMYDTVKLDLKPNITVLDTNKIEVMPFIASIDSLIKIGNKDVKVKANYNQPKNQFTIDIAQSWLDSIMNIRQIDTIKTTDTRIEYINRLDWYMYIIFAVCLIFAIVVGIFINKLIK